MNKLVKTSKTLDMIFRFLCILIDIAAVFMIVGLVIVAAGSVFNLPAKYIGTDFNVVGLGFLTLTVADEAVPGLDQILGQAAVESALTLVYLVIGHLMIRCIRNILQPMTKGEPFQDTISVNLKRLALYILLLGIGQNCREVISSMLLVKAFDLTHLLVSDKVISLTFNYPFRLGFLTVSAAFLLLSYIFRYGEELQQLSDETL